jgi:hypothetical protein
MRRIAVGARHGCGGSLGSEADSRMTQPTGTCSVHAQLIRLNSMHIFRILCEAQSRRPVMSADTQAEAEALGARGIGLADH